MTASPDRSTTYEIALLGLIALGVIVLTGIGVYGATKTSAQFDPAAYLVVLTLIVSAIKERQQARSVDRMGQKLGESQPTTVEPGTTTTTTTVEPSNGAPTGTPEDPISTTVVNELSDPVPVTPKPIKLEKSEKSEKKP